jgi:hypothetical protein
VVSTFIVGARPALSAPRLRGESSAAAFAPAAEARSAVATVPAAGTCASSTSVPATGTRSATASASVKNQKRDLRRARAHSSVLCARRSQRQVPRRIPASRRGRGNPGTHGDPATSLRGSGEDAAMLASLTPTLEDEEASTSPFRPVSPCEKLHSEHPAPTPELVCRGRRWPVRPVEGAFATLHVSARRSHGAIT